MLNSQPLGLHSPSQLVQDAKLHDADVRAVDVMVGEVDCSNDVRKPSKTWMPIVLKSLKPAIRTSRSSETAKHRAMGKAMNFNRSKRREPRLQA